MLDTITVKERGKAVDGEGDVGTSAGCYIHKAANELAVWGSLGPVSYVGRDRDAFVRPLELETGDHWCVGGVGVALVESVQKSVYEGCL